MADEQVFVCGGTGTLTPEAQAELDAFAVHLREHMPAAERDDCRFCQDRLARKRRLATRPEVGT